MDIIEVCGPPPRDEIHIAYVWYSTKDTMPSEYKLYIVCKHIECNKCDNGIEHSHNLNFRQNRYGIARWSEKDPIIVAYYQSKGDHSWDYCSIDRWTECNLKDEEITHWAHLPVFMKELEK